MTIHIIEEQGPDLYLTASEHARLLDEYQKAFMFYAGTPPSFEAWVRSRGTTTVLANGTSMIAPGCTVRC